MGKDDNNSKSSRSGRLGQRKPSTNQPQLKVDCILCFKDPKPSNNTIKARFAKSNGVKVSKQIHGYKTGNNKANLVALMNIMGTLGDLYEMWENEKSKNLAQKMSQAVEGQV
jgi:hypothetical protein